MYRGQAPYAIDEPQRAAARSPRRSHESTHADVALIQSRCTSATFCRSRRRRAMCIYIYAPVSQIRRRFSIHRLQSARGSGHSSLALYCCMASSTILTPGKYHTPAADTHSCCRRRRARAEIKGDDAINENDVPLAPVYTIVLPVIVPSESIPQTFQSVSSVRELLQCVSIE